MRVRRNRRRSKNKVISRFSVRLAGAAIVLGAMFAPVVARAGIDDVASLTQAQFKPLAHDLVSALSYKAVTPAEPLGISGFDIGIGLSVVQTSKDLPWSIALGSEKSLLTVPRISLQKGLPFDFDIGGFYASVPGTGIQFFGGELKYAIVDGGAVLPAVAVRAATTKLAGVDQLDLDTRSLEITVSKGFLNFTPYAGAGKVWGDVTPDNAAASGLTRLKQESPDMVRVYAGVNFSIFLGSLTLEVDRTGDNLGASARIGLRF